MKRYHRLIGVGIKQESAMVASTLSSGNRRKTTSSSAELNQAVDYFQKESDRLSSAREFAENADALIKGASDLVLQKFLVVQGSQEKYPEVWELIDLILKSLTWSLTGGGKDLLDQYLLTGLRELLTALGHSPLWYIEALKYVKDNHNLTGKAAGEMNTLIHYVIDALN